MWEQNRLSFKGLQCSIRCVVVMFNVILVVTLGTYLVLFTKSGRASEQDLFYENFKSELLLQQGQDQQPSEKPYVVLGILSSDEYWERRKVIRNTWLKTIRAMESQLPFRMTYKFYLDKNSTATYEESKIHGDIVYLDTPEHGYSIKFGRKMHILLRHWYTHHREAALGIRIDDDAFLCVPQVFHRIKQVMSPNLYYGWSHGAIDGYKIPMIDEMFLAVGKNIIRWVATRPYCGSSKCSTTTLQGAGHGSTSLRNWLADYKDLDIHTDNERIDQIHIPADSTDWMKYAKFDYCKNNVVFHKVKISSFMKVMHRNSERLYAKTANIGSVSGKPFSGEKARPLPNVSYTEETIVARDIDRSKDCSFWAVVTTVFDPSDSIRYIASLSEWCMVIVADIKTPKEKDFMTKLGYLDSKKIIYLSVEKQLHLYPLLTDSLPFSSFARKNIGYIFAIHNKAKLIWDFDDDNYGIISQQGYSHIKEYLSPCEGSANTALINPYPYFKETDVRLWPRGFPLNELKNPVVLPKLCLSNKTKKYAVIQSLANGEADVDAIFRLTYSPFNFTAKPDVDKMLVLPKNTYTPFNAQATLWFPAAFRYMALPISVHGRVTDIWRSYIAEYFFHKLDLSLAFSPPYIYHNRTKHNIMGDFHAETPLYEQSGKLVDLLSSSNYDNLVSLYNDLFQRQYIHQSDLQFISAWEKTFKFIS